MPKDKFVTNYLAVSNEEFNNRSQILHETFKGEVLDKEVQFPKGLGAEHPFNLSLAEKIIQNIGIVNALVDKIVDSIIGDFTISLEDSNAQALLDRFIEESNFKSQIRPWAKEAVAKGGGFMELDLVENKIRVMNSNNMYIKRNRKGEVIEYNQFVGDLKLFSTGKRKAISFKPHQIAFIPINKIPNDPYGFGLVWPNRVAIENYASNELAVHKLLSRKAGAPIHVKLGQPGQSVKQADIDNFKSKLQFMTNSTEWVTDANIEMLLIDFKGIADNLIKALEHDLEQIAIGMKIPMALVGIANNPEGLAKVNDKEFLRFIKSTRTLIEEVIENSIFRPILIANNLLSKVNFQWDLPGEEEKNTRLKILQEAMKNPFMSPELKAGIEKEYAEMLELDEVVKVLSTPEQASDKSEIRRREEEEIKQPEVPGAKPTANEKEEVNLKEVIRKVGKEFCVFSKTGKNLGCFPTRAQAVKRLGQIEHFKKKSNQKIEDPVFTEEQLNEMSVAEYVNITPLEEKGFNYTDYLVKILQALKIDPFDELKAKSDQDLLRGLLPKRDIEKLRFIMRDAFRKNRTIRQIEKDIKESIDLKNRTKIEDGKEKITLLAEKRPINIARTETIRLANQGLKNLYLDNGVESYRYLAALDDRTSEICLSLNGRIFQTKDGRPGVNMPPMHAMCRSTIVGVVT